MRQPFLSGLAVLGIVAGLGAQQAAPQKAPAAPPTAAAATPASSGNTVTPPADYVIGPADVLAVVVWREPDMSVEVVVRPDGRISLPLLDEVDVAGLTPDQLAKKLAVEAQRFVKDPVVSVLVKQINSRRVFITGQVAKPAPYPLISAMNVLQLISTAGGLLEYAKEKDIIVMRTENARPVIYKFNYDEVAHGKNPKQNLDLKPGDTVVVP